MYVTHAHTHTQTHTNTHKHTHRNSGWGDENEDQGVGTGWEEGGWDSHPQVCLYVCVCVCVCARARACVQASLSRARALSLHAYARARTHTHTHMHTHKHTGEAGFGPLYALLTLYYLLFTTYSLLQVKQDLDHSCVAWRGLTACDPDQGTHSEKSVSRDYIA